MQNSNHRLSDLSQALKAVSTGKDTVLVEEIENGISEAVNKVKNGTVVTVTSAVAFNQTEKNRMERYVADLLQKKTMIEYRIEPKILGGFKIIVGDWNLDGSLLAQIEAIKNLFNVTHNG